MTEKVKVTKEVANAIELAKEKHGDYLLHEVLRKLELNSKFRDELAPLNKLLNTQRVLAITVGYEIEHTPEDKVREIYSTYNVSDDVFPVYFSCNIADVIIDVLDGLDIKIEGVNS